MNLDYYTKEFFEKLGWKWIDFENKFCKEKSDWNTDWIDQNNATQIAKEVQRREIAAKLYVMHLAMKCHSVDSEDYCKTMQRDINQLEQQLKALDEV